MAEIPEAVWGDICDNLRGLPRPLGRLALVSKDVGDAVRGSPTFRALFKCQRTLRGHADLVLCVAALADGRVASGAPSP